MATVTENHPGAKAQAPEPKAPSAAPAKAPATTPSEQPKGPMGLINKWGNWMGNHKPAAIAIGVGSGALIAVVAAAYPLWKKVIKPRLDEMKRQKAAGRHAKRSADDEIIEEALQDEEFLEFLADLAAEFQ